MKAVVWHGNEDVRVDRVSEPHLQEPTDAVIRVTATGLCGSDLHLYSKLGPVMRRGDILGHEAVGIVEELGSAVTNLRAGDRVVVPFNIACGTCFFCASGLQSQCDTTQNKALGKGASLFGYTHLYGAVPGGQAEYLRVPFAGYGPIKVEDGVPDERLFLMADVLPTAWQAVAFADVPPARSVAVFGLGPIGQMASRIALHLGADQVFGIDQVPERLAMAQRHGVETIDFAAVDDVPGLLRELTEGRGPDAVIDAVGMEADGSAIERGLQAAKLQPDRLTALRTALRSVRRGGTVSLSGVYAAIAPFFPIGNLFDREITIRMGQANVRRWVDDVLPLLLDPADPLGTSDLVTHVMPLAEAPKAYDIFQRKQDGCVKVVFRP